MTLELALTIIGGPLQTATKMPCYTYSISAKACKRGGKLYKVPGSVCNKCYARRGNFVRPTIQISLDRRMVATEHPLWVDAMVVVLNACEFSGFFRWFASGDLQSLGHLVKICEVVKRTPHIKHWLPTHEIGILGAFKRAGFEFPSNLTVRLSADMLEQQPNPKTMSDLGIVGGAVSKQQWNCRAPQQENRCQACRVCWDKRVRVVTYKYH